MKITRKSINQDLSNILNKSMAQKLITMILDDILSWIIMKIWHLKIFLSDNAAITTSNANATKAERLKIYYLGSV